MLCVSASDTVVDAMEVPVNVTVPDSAGAPVAAARLRLTAVPGVSVSDDGFAVTPEGSPEIATDTLPENPLIAVANTETVDGVPFDGKLTEAGLTLSEKSAAAVCTEREPWVLAAWPPMVVLKESIAVDVAAADPARLDPQQPAAVRPDDRPRELPDLDLPRPGLHHGANRVTHNQAPDRRTR